MQTTTEHRRREDPQVGTAYEGVDAATLLCLLVACLLGYAVQRRGGTYEPLAIAILAATWIAGVSAFFAVSRGRGRRITQAFWWLGGLTLIVEASCLVSGPPGVYMKLQSAEQLQLFLVLVIIMTVLAAAGLSATPWLGKARMPALLAAHFLAGVWIINISPQPFIDVFVVIQDSCAAFLKGVNPYSITFPDIYGGKSQFFAPGVSVGGRLMFGFPYPPLCLLLALPGYAATADSRYAQAAAVVAAAALMTYCRRGRIGALAAAIFLLTPRGFQVIEDSWTDPFVVLTLAACVYTALRWPGALPIAVGCFLSSKQYAVIFAPLTWLLVGDKPARSVLRFYGIVLATIVVLNVPFIAWDLRAFISSTLTFHIHSPFRPDSLSLAAWAFRSGWGAMPSWAPFAALVPLYIIALAKLPRTPQAFALAIVGTSLTFFALGKQAFLNYHYFTIGAACCAIAASIQPIPANSARPTALG